MNTPKLLAALVVVTALVGPMACADSFAFTNNQAIPDGQPAGVSDVETITSGISQIGAVQVSLNISGDFNGDLYCYLQHSNALSVLLNRPGRTAGNTFGYADSGFNLTLMDLSTNGNIHTYQGMVTPAAGQPLTGVWSPDGRTTSPASVLDTDPSLAGLSLFNNMNASGNWTLFIADLSPGGTSVLTSWQLNFLPVPEPSVEAMGVLGFGVFALVRNREKKFP